MSLKLLMYAQTGSPYALRRALELIDTLHDSLNDVEELLLEQEPPAKEA